MKVKSAAVVVSVFSLILFITFVSVVTGSQADRFSADASGIATDSQTGFQWVAGPDQDMDWPTAKQWVENLKLDGGGWRMPKVPELHKLLESGQPDFIPYEGMAFWSGDPVDEGAEEIWVYSPEMGFEAPVPPFVAPFNRVLAVRGDTPQKGTIKKDHLAASDFYDQGMALRTAPEDKMDIMPAKFSDPKAAIGYFSQAIAADPTFTKAYNYRGTAYVQMMNYEKALADFIQALQIDDQYYVARIYRAWCFMKMSKRNEAATQYNLALQQDPALPQAYLGRGLVSLINNNKAAACQDMKKACDLGACGFHIAHCR